MIPKKGTSAFLYVSGALRRGARNELIPFCTAALCLLFGCAGGGRVEIATLDFRAIDPPAPRFAHVDLDRCYWWTDEQGQVWIAMERDQPLIVRPEHFIFQLSLVLEKLPAGRERNYLVNKRELRGVAKVGPAEGRYISLNGIVALYREPGDRMRGSFRLEVAQESLGLLGWSSPRRQLMMGSFVAVPDTGRGKTVAAGTESPGWERAPRTSTQAATQPAATRPTATQPAGTQPAGTRPLPLAP